MIDHYPGDGNQYEDDEAPIPPALLIEARQVAPLVGFEFSDYETEWFGVQSYYPGTPDAAYLDWLGLHMFNQAEEDAEPGPLAPTDWTPEVWDFYHRLERRNAAVSIGRDYYRGKEGTEP